MTEIEGWIHDAIASQGIHAEILPPQQAEAITAEARGIFVNGNTRAWWLALKVNADVCSSNDKSLADVLPERKGSCWFIPETEADTLPVYKVPIEDVPKLINESPFFEYYILGQNLDWLVIESDHNEYFVCRLSRAPA
jgi:hypothetical protein